MKHKIAECPLCQTLLQDLMEDLMDTLLALNKHCDDLAEKKGKYFDDEGREYDKT